MRSHTWGISHNAFVCICGAPRGNLLCVFTYVPPTHRAAYFMHAMRLLPLFCVVFWACSFYGFCLILRAWGACPMHFLWSPSFGGKSSMRFVCVCLHKAPSPLHFFGRRAFGANLLRIFTFVGRHGTTSSMHSLHCKPLWAILYAFPCAFDT